MADIRHPLQKTYPRSAHACLKACCADNSAGVSTGLFAAPVRRLEGVWCWGEPAAARFLAPTPLMDTTNQ